MGEEVAIDDGGVSDEKPRTLFVGNIPKQVTKRDLETVFGDIGPLKRCYIQYPRDDKKYRIEETTLAYVTYALAEDAVKAIEQLDGYKFGTNKISIKYAKSRTEQHREPAARFGFGDNQDEFRVPNNHDVVTKPEKAVRPKQIKKKSRLIIRNLSFQANEGNIREYFESYGKITDINILRKPNGKLVGCAFIQYETVAQAARALRELNSKPFLSRPIAIDWSLPKEKFQQNPEESEKSTTSTEPSEFDPNIKIKTEPPDDDLGKNYDYVEQASKIKVETTDGDIKIEGLDDDSDFDENTGSPRKKGREQNFNDADDGKTLFIRNLEFETTVEELKKFFETYGPLNYGVICKDKLTEHPKGTAFVMFRNSADASTCLQEYENEQSKFKLGRRQFVVSMALSKTKLETKLKNDVVKEPKDKRNLYLAREGYIRPETNAAIGVSVADMNKRTAILRTKRQMLKNLNIFVSDTRLCVHNLLPTTTDNQLRKIMFAHGGPGAKITEARIMRDLQATNLDGVGQSKEYGFVSFTTHENALKALRTVNNNPKIFTPGRRPIVEFSLENRAAIKAKEKRTLKSRERNPKRQKIDIEDSEKTDDVSNSTEGGGKKSKKARKGKSKKESDKSDTTAQDRTLSSESTDQLLPSYSGLTAMQGVSSLPSLKPKGKGKITRNSLKTKLKSKKKLLPRRNKEPQIKPSNKKSKEDKVDKLVKNYQEKIHKVEKSESKVRKTKKSRWFQ